MVPAPWVISSDEDRREHDVIHYKFITSSNSSPNNERTKKRVLGNDAISSHKQRKLPLLNHTAGVVFLLSRGQDGRRGHPETIPKDESGGSGGADGGPAGCRGGGARHGSHPHAPLSYLR